MDAGLSPDSLGTWSSDFASGLRSLKHTVCMSVQPLPLGCAKEQRDVSLWCQPWRPCSWEGWELRGGCARTTWSAEASCMRPVRARLRPARPQEGQEGRDAFPPAPAGFSCEASLRKALGHLRPGTVLRRVHLSPRSRLWPRQCGGGSYDLSLPEAVPASGVRPAESREHRQNGTGLGEEGAEPGPTGL